MTILYGSHQNVPLTIPSLTVLNHLFLKLIPQFNHDGALKKHGKAYIVFAFDVTGLGFARTASKGVKMQFPIFKQTLQLVSFP